MNTKLQDEKFISIEYETWQNKYLPLEQKVKVLQEELKNEIDNKTININLRLDQHWIGRRNIGCLTPEGEVIWKNTEYTEQNLLEALQAFKYRFGIYFPSKEDVKAIGEENRELCETYKKINERISNLPRIIKWLFKIK